MWSFGTRLICGQRAEEAPPLMQATHFGSRCSESPRYSPMCAHSDSGRDRKNLSTLSSTPWCSAQSICSFSLSNFKSAGVSCQASRISGSAGFQPPPARLRFGNISQSVFHCEGIGHTLLFSPQHRVKSSLSRPSIQSEGCFCQNSSPNQLKACSF